MTLRPLMARQFSSLGTYNYRVYFFGQMISLVGTWMQTTAQAWLVLDLTGSSGALGTVVALQFLPITLFTLFGGVFADRLPKRRMLVITQALSLVQAAVLGILVATGTVELWHIYLLALMLGTINAFDGPVRQAFSVELVGREQLVNAVALNSSIFNVARIIGPAVAGVVIGVIGMAPAFFMNAISYVAVLGAYAVMRPAEFHSPPARPANTTVLKQVGEGLRYSWNTPSVLFLFILLAFIGTFGYNFTIVIPLVAKFVLHTGPGGLGVLTSAMGVGSLIAALGLAASGRASQRVLVLSTAIFIAIFTLIAASQWIAVTAALLVGLGVVSIFFSTTINTTLQLIVPDELRGRVMSIFFLLFAGSTPIGGAITGWLADGIGVPRTLAVEAAICGIGLAVALAYRWTHSAAFREQPVRPAPARSAAQ